MRLRHEPTFIILGSTWRSAIHSSAIWDPQNRGISRFLTPFNVQFDVLSANL
jgi:hypothetical protein